MPLAPDFHTAVMVRSMPDDGNRYEVVWGELLVTPMSWAKRFTVGVDTVWLVDTVRRSVETWRPDSTFGAVESERVVWHPSGATEPLTVELARLFA